MHEDDKAPFTEHLEELRKRLITSIIAVFVCFLITYGFKETLFKILTHPLVSVMAPGDHLIFTGLPEAFFTYLKVSLLAAIMLAAPVIFYEFWMFVAPGLYKEERRMLLPIVLLSSVFFVGGALFGYFIVFPVGFRFFLSFATESIRPMPSMKQYLDFSSKLLIAFGVIFELPLALTFLAKLGIVTVDHLKKFRKYSVVLIFIVSAILTPPDVASQIMMAVPLLILYEISILGAKVFGKKKKKTDDDIEDEATA